MNRIMRAPAADSVGQDEAGRPFGQERVGPLVPDPYRDRHHDDRRRPGDGVQRRADPGGAKGLVKQVRGVAKDVEEQTCGQEHPWRLAATREHGEATDHQAQKEHVTDGVGEVRHCSEDVSPAGLQDAAEGEGGTHRRRPEAGDDTVQPVGDRHPPHLAPNEEHHGYIGERVKGEVEDVRQ